MPAITAAQAEIMVAGAGIYLALGLVFAAVYAFALIGFVSPGARTRAPLQFRLLILPGLTLLWPLAAAASLARALAGGASAAGEHE